MAQSQASISNKQFITMSVNLLHKAFIESTRTHSKQLFRQLSEGGKRTLTQVKMVDGATVRLDVSFDLSAYKGKLNYSAFRDQLLLLMANFVESMKDGEEPKMFRAEGEEHKMLFGVTAPAIEQDRINIMALAAEVSPNSPVVLLQLIYLPPDQFIEPAQQDSGVLGA